MAEVLIVYDSVYGCTEQIAWAIGQALGSPEDVKALRVGNVKPEQLTELKLLIVGSPTQGGRPTAAIQAFLKDVPESVLKDISVAAFDTRVSARLARIFGYAADKIAAKLKERGGILVAPPEGFFVAGTEGPVKEGEIERAANWARTLIRN